MNRFRSWFALVLDFVTLSRFHGRLLQKFVAIFTSVVCIALLAFAILDVLFFYQDHRATLIRTQQEQAEDVAEKIADHMRNIEDQLVWTTYEPWSMAAPEQERVYHWRLLLRQVPAISDLQLLDASGREQLRISRVDLDRIGSGIDLSRTPAFLEAELQKPYRGPVYFRRASEPYMTIAIRARNGSVSVAEVNLVFIWDVVSRIKVGEHGRAYVVDSSGRLIAHPDISMVLRETDLSGLSQVRATRSGATVAPGAAQFGEDTYGQKVLTASAPVGTLDWRVFVELPIEEAYAPLYALVSRASIVFVLGVVLAIIAEILLVRKIVRPLERLEQFASAVRESKNYAMRVDYQGDDEIGRLAAAFNGMLAELSAARERETSDQIELGRAARLTTVGAMTASIAHEINQPLAAIAANANAGLRWLGRSTPNIEEVRAALTRINNDAHRASEVIQSIRSVFKKGTQDLAPLDMNALVLEVVGFLHGELANFRVAVQPGLLEDLPQVVADRIQLQQVMLNLIMNAAEAMNAIEDRERILTITSRTQAPDQVLITVQDTGTGIDPRNAERIFEAFFSTKSSGMGMGLFICRSIIEAHGGRLWGAPADPHGSVFSILLPAASGQSGEADAVVAASS